MRTSTVLNLKTNRSTRASFPSPAKRMGGFFNVSTMVETYALNVSTCACFKICIYRHKKLIFFSIFYDFFWKIKKNKKKYMNNFFYFKYPKSLLWAHADLWAGLIYPMKINLFLFLYTEYTYFIWGQNRCPMGLIARI